MKIALLLSVLTITQLWATETYSQKTRLTLKLEDVKIADALKTIEDQSEFFFLYSPKLIDVERKVSIDAKNETINGILNDIFGNSVKSAVYDRQVVIFPDNQPAKLAEVPQQKQITGTVTDKDGNPFPGVNVVVTGTNTGTMTDGAGKYTINIPEGGKSLTFTFIGMTPQEIAIGTQSQINVSMVESAIGLEEVIVIGYGTAKKSDLTGAISSVSAEELHTVQASNVLEQAQGKLAGVDIVESNGTPGSNQTIRIRGNRSITAGNDPLFVVDGIPTSQGINDFNPGDIESMEVLKDASAVAIYGSRGANGVILITTKHGGKGKAKISLDAYYGVKDQLEDFNIMSPDQFVEYKRVAYGYSKTDNSHDATLLGPLYNNYLNGISTNYLDHIYRNGMQMEYQLSASGGDDKLSYYLSGSYYDETGLIRKTDYNRYSLRANLDATLTKKIKVGLSLTTSKDLRNNMSDPTGNAIRYVPITQGFDADGNVIAYPNPDEALIASPLVNFAPNQYVDETKGFRLFSNLYGEYQIIPGLKYRLNFGTDILYSRRGRFTGDYAGDTPEGSVANSNVFNYTIENILSFDKTMGEHNINLVGLFSTQVNSTESSSLSARGIPITRSTFYDLGSAATITGISSQLTEWGLLSYMGRINYKFRDRYLLTASGRADGSSRLAKGNKWAFFPAASLAWIISKENFMKSIQVLSFLKLRAGYGSVGNTAISPYQTQGGLIRSAYAFGDNSAFGYQLDGIANPNLGWEISRTLNIGLDFGLWKDRISGSLEVYDTRTSDLLLQRLLPSTSGYTSVVENIGSTRNRGWELTLSANVLSGLSGFKWDVDLNLFSNKEEIVQLFNGTTDDIGNKWFIGQPINSFYDYVFDGIWQTDEAAAAAAAGQAPGQIKIKDVNGRDSEGVLTKQPDGIINTDDRAVLGSTNPKWTGGITNKVSYKGFDFSLLIYARQGQMLSTNFYDLSGNNWEGRRSALVFDYWTPDNPSNKYPQPVQGKQIIYASSLNYFDGSFVKIKNVSLGYDFARNLIKTPAISSFRVYLSATNPVIWSPFKLVDPETGSALSSATYIVGINLKF